MNKKLRIGLLIDDYILPAWISRMLEIITSSHHSEITLTVKKKEKSGKTSISDLWESRNILAFNLLQKLDYMLFSHHPDAFKKVDVRQIIKCDELEIIPYETLNGEVISENDIDKIKAYAIDVFIKIGFHHLTGEIFNSAKYGVWSFNEGNKTISKGDIAGVWEVMKNHSVTRIELQILNKKGLPVKIYESFSATDKYSIKRNRDFCYWKASSMLPRKLKEIYDSEGTNFIDSLPQPEKNLQLFSRTNKVPENLISLKAFLRIYSNKIVTVIQNNWFVEQWVLLYQINENDNPSTTFRKFIKILPPPDRFWADPFVIKRNGKIYIFFEELFFKENKGKIAVIEIKADGSVSDPIIVLEKDYHLSYPFLFEDNGELYMIPETSNNRTIELYKCINFPDKWEFVKNLIDNIFAVDTTIFKKDNKFWMFCNVIENEGASSNDELFLFYSEKLDANNWISHPANPIISDVRKSRPAGNLYIKNGKLYRPSQDSAVRYGHGIIINEIMEMNENSYHEHTIQTLYPTWDKSLLGTHTLNSYENVTVIDAMIKRRKG